MSHYLFGQHDFQIICDTWWETVPKAEDQNYLQNRLECEIGLAIFVKNKFMPDSCHLDPVVLTSPFYQKMLEPSLAPKNLQIKKKDEILCLIIFSFRMTEKKSLNEP